MEILSKAMEWLENYWLWMAGFILLIVFRRLGGRHRFPAWWWIDKILFFGFLLPGPFVAILATIGTIPKLSGYAAAVFFLVLWGKGLASVEFNRRVVKEVFGYKHGAGEAGLRWKVPFVGGFIQFPTTKVELEHPIVNTNPELKGFGVLTKRGAAADGGRVLAQVNVGVETSFQFNYPDTPSALIKIAELLPPPELEMRPVMEGGVQVEEEETGNFDFSRLSDFLEEPIGDAVRDVGGESVYMDLLRQRNLFARNIHTALTEEYRGENSVIKQIMIDELGMEKNSLKLTIKHINLPPELRDAIRAEETEALKLAGMRHTAEGIKETEKKRQEGVAEGRKARYEAAGARTFEEKKIVDWFITQEGMANGPATTIFISGIMDALGGSGQGGGPLTAQILLQAFRAATPAQRAQLLALLQGQP